MKIFQINPLFRYVVHVLYRICVVLIVLQPHQLLVGLSDDFSHFVVMNIAVFKFTYMLHILLLYFVIDQNVLSEKIANKPRDILNVYQHIFVRLVVVLLMEEVKAFEEFNQSDNEEKSFIFLKINYLDHYFHKLNYVQLVCLLLFY